MASIVAGDRRGGGGLKQKKTTKGSASSRGAALPAGGLRRGAPYQPDRDGQMAVRTGSKPTGSLTGVRSGSAPAKITRPVLGPSMPNPRVIRPKPGTAAYRKMVKTKNKKAGRRSF